MLTAAATEPTLARRAASAAAMAGGAVTAGCAAVARAIGAIPELLENALIAALVYLILLIPCGYACHYWWQNLDGAERWTAIFFTVLFEGLEFFSLTIYLRSTTSEARRCAIGWLLPVIMLFNGGMMYAPACILAAAKVPVPVVGADIQGAIAAIESYDEDLERLRAQTWDTPSDVRAAQFELSAQGFPPPNGLDGDARDGTAAAIRDAVKQIRDRQDAFERIVRNSERQWWLRFVWYAVVGLLVALIGVVKVVGRWAYLGASEGKRQAEPPPAPPTVQETPDMTNVVQLRPRRPKHPSYKWAEWKRMVAANGGREPDPPPGRMWVKEPPKRGAYRPLGRVYTSPAYAITGVRHDAAAAG